VSRACSVFARRVYGKAQMCSLWVGSGPFHALCKAGGHRTTDSETEAESQPLASRRGVGGKNPRCAERARNARLPRRGLPQGLGAAETPWHPYLKGAGTPPNA